MERAVIQLAMTNLPQEFGELSLNETAERYFIGNAQELKRIEMVETSLRDNTKVVITENGINPTLLLGSLPFSVSSESNGRLLK